MAATTNEVTTTLLVLILLLGWEDPVTCRDDCPDLCSCKWKNGKQTVECVNASLDRVPDVFDKETQVLDLSQNFIPLLTEKLFVNLRLVNLQKIFITQSSVRNVEDHCFKGLTNLIELDLSHNALTVVPRLGLEDCKQLMRLSLRGNRISKIAQDDFYFLTDLNSLDLAECGLEHIHPEAFHTLKNLEYLRLEGNQLRTLTPLGHFAPNLRLGKIEKKRN